MLSFLKNKTAAELLSEQQCQEQLINQILIATTALGLISYVMIQIRALDFGWGTRELLQTLLLSALFIASVKHKQLSAQFKAGIVIGVLVIMAFVGLLTLGPAAAAIFALPMAAIILSLYYSSRTILIFLSIIAAGLLGVAYSYINGALKTQFSLSYLTTNTSHWATYITAFICCCVIAAVAIYNYRHSTRTLLKQVQAQKYELEITSGQLLDALKEIKTLQEIIPLCSYCRKIRSDDGAWKSLEKYLAEHSDSVISHGICPDCLQQQRESESL